MVSIFWTLEVLGWISFLSSGNFELQVFLLTYCHLEPALNKPFCTLLFTLHLKGRPGPDHGLLDQGEAHTCPLTIWCEMCALNGLPTRCMQPSDSPFPVALPSTRKHRSWSSISSFEPYNDCWNIFCANFDSDWSWNVRNCSEAEKKLWRGVKLNQNWH